jgi:hypothetical protein
MKTLSLGRPILYSAILLVMVFSAAQLSKPTKVKAEAGCCTYGQDCTTRGAPKCCIPHSGEAWCSEADQNYCKLSCI